MTIEPIVLKSHDPKWITSFEMESKLLNANLADYIVKIHHVGSTAIPSIQAKPVIDITIESSVYPPSNSIAQKLTDLGYELRGDGGVVGRIWFSKGIPRAFNLHWCPLNGAVVQSQIQFRNALLSDYTLAKEYEKIKLNASSGRNIDSPKYAEEKSSFILNILSL